MYIYIYIYIYTTIDSSKIEAEGAQGVYWTFKGTIP